MLLRELLPETPPPEMELYLRHIWRLCNPSKPDQFFALGTIWTDREGVRIQGDALRNFAAVIQKRIAVGSVYKITGFTLRPPRATYRTCRFPQWLAFTALTSFELQPEPDPAFADEAMEYVRLAKLPSRLPPCPYVTDFVGKVIVVGKPNYVDRPTGVAPVQNLTVVDASGVEVQVSLWSELSSIIDAETIVLDDVANPVIIACSAFRIHLYHDKPHASSTLSSRIFLDPTDSTAEELRQNFTLHARPITYVPPKFDTPEKLKQHVQASVRTLEELLAMYVAGGDADPAYRCDATIVGFEREQPWFYKACPSCSRAVVANGHDFWCFNHDTVPAADVAYRYRLKLYVQDSTTSVTFVLLGMTADRILPISAADLARAYPDDYGPLPPVLQLLIGQHATFEVHLPRNARLNTHEDIRVSKIWGLVIPRAQVLASLPPPPPPRSPSPPARHDTPIPPDPAYVPPVPTATPPSASIPVPASCSPLPKNTHPTPADQPHSPALPEMDTSHRGLPLNEPPLIAATKPPVCNVWKPVVPTTPIKSVISPVPTSSTPMDPADDLPISSFLKRRRPLLHQVPTPSVPTVPPRTPGQLSSALLASSPLAVVKQERLSDTITDNSKANHSAQVAPPHPKNNVGYHFHTDTCRWSPCLLTDPFNISIYFVARFMDNIFSYFLTYSLFILQYDPTDIPSELQSSAIPVDALIIGNNKTSCLLRLIHTWRDHHSSLATHVGPIHSQWIDVKGTRIQGYTEATHAAIASPLLFPGTIYIIQDPTLIRASTIFQTCPYHSSLLVKPQHLLRQVYEEPSKPYFPRDAFSVTPSYTIRHLSSSSDFCSDVVGRLVAITDPIETSGHGLSFQVLADEPTSHRIYISFTAFFPTPDFSLGSIAAAERLGPVICIFTAVTGYHVPDGQYQLQSTPGSRILFAPFEQSFCTYFDMFAHHHIPVRLTSPTSPACFTTLRGHLPRKLPLSTLLTEYPTLSLQTHVRTWCLVRIISVAHHTHNIITSGPSRRYAIIAHCADATTTTHLLFAEPAANMLLKHQAHEYDALPQELQIQILESLTGRMFIVELSSLTSSETTPARFLVDNIWDPVVAFY
ncbi:Replication protein A 70 kDa DNA-binding subunit E [Linum grandiflorum]